MKILAQRGENYFLAESDDKYYIVNTGKKEKFEVKSPDIAYRSGYWEPPKPTNGQISILEELIK